jgi:hypothetical protein
VRRLFLILGLAVLVSPVGVAHATPPARFVDRINDTFVDRSCGFPVTVHLEGTSTFTAFFDADGTFVRSLGTYPGLRISFTANGKTLSSPAPAIDIDTFNEDGTVDVFIAGLLAHLSIPGQGIVAIDTGLRIYLFTEDGPNLVRKVGASTFDTFEGPILELCDALAAS